MARMMIAKTSRLLWCALMILSASATVAPSAHAQPLPCRYEVAAVIQAPSCGAGGVSTIGTAINPSGTTVVGYRFCLGTAKPWKWTQSGGLVMLTLPSWLIEATPADVNDNNIMVGTGEVIGIGQRGFVCDLNTMTWSALAPQNPPAGLSGANAINNENVVVGWRSMGSKGDPVNPRTAFTWSAQSGFVDFGLFDGNSTAAVDIANSGAVAIGFGFGLGAYVWNGGQSGSIGTLRGADGLTPNAITDDHHVVGGALFIQGSDSWAVPFEFTLGALHALPVLNQVHRSCTALEVGAQGLVVGGCCTIPGLQWVPCAWQNGHVIDLRERFPSETGLDYGQVIAITSDGRLICNAGSKTVVLDPVAQQTGDTNCDDRVDVDDLVAVILDWGKNNSTADVNHDGIVDLDDLIVVINNWSIA